MRNKYYRDLNFKGSIRFRGIVIKEYRSEVLRAFMDGTWSVTEDKIFDIIKPEVDGLCTAPFKPLIWPKQWLTLDTYYHDWNALTGELTFSCTVFNKSEFDKLLKDTLPFIIEQVEICEVWIAKPRSKPNDSSGTIIKYDLQDNKWIELGRENI